MLISGTQFVLSGTKVTCNFNIQPDLWPCIADENQIGQVLDNIIINAIQAMPMGGEITIKADNIVISSNDSVHYLSPGHYVRVSITDQGTGIPDSLLSRIFDPFYTTKSTGTGLGLATSYSIIKKHGGTITADSREGEWSTFTFYLPSALDNATETSITSYDKMPSFTGKVLVMDDEEFIRLTTKKLLEAVGIEVDTASHGEEAISIYRSAISTGNPYSAVILDLTVKGGLGGKETVTILRSIDPEVPVIASSGYSADPVMANPALYGFNDRLIKPYTLEDLIIILKKLKISSNR